jgi:protein-disulfide isomerase
LLGSDISSTPVAPSEPSLADPSQMPKRSLYLLALTVVVLVGWTTALSVQVSGLKQEVAILSAPVPVKPLTPEAVKTAIMADPKMLIEAVQKLQGTQAPASGQAPADHQMAAATSAKAINTLAPVLFDAHAPWYLGNPKGKVAFAEFIDYQCPHCKDAAVGINSWLKDHPDDKVLIFQSPIFGPISALAARAAIAAADQGKFAAMHEALMQTPDPLTAVSITDAASKAGLDMTKFGKSLQNDKTQAEVDGQLAIGQQIGVSGTPGFASPHGLQEGYYDEAHLDQWLKN